MMNFLLRKILGSQNERMLKRLWPIVPQINALESEISRLSDAELRAKTEAFRQRVRDELARLEREQLPPQLDPEIDEVEARTRQRRHRQRLERLVLDALLPEAFAVVRETAKRHVRMRHFDVQLIGGIVLHRGQIAEMATGEGKTLVATLAAYLNALTGRGVHIVTVNDYLARRDRAWMGPIYETLGLTVGVIHHGLSDAERQQAYACDVTYGTNNEFGFDYLRDNMKYRLEDLVHREFHFAIVDEVDSILIDEARTPLIISGPAELETEQYYDVDRAVQRLQRDSDFQMDEKAQTVALTEAGIAKCEAAFHVDNLYDSAQLDLIHKITAALRAHAFFKLDDEYVVKDGEIIIVDEFTGRLMPGRRWSDGLHQAIEAKEGVRIRQENQTLATVTFQNYFRMYEKLAGMTGTAATEANEFKQIYGLDVAVVPTNQPLIRTNYPDVVYKSVREKFHAIVEEIATLHREGRPMLVGTISIEKSERLSALLTQRGIAHHVLNAKQHEREAHIVAQAGRFGAVTIATNMAGRGTDILLGGNPDFLAADRLAQLEIGRGAEVSEAERASVMEEVRRQVEEEHRRVVAVGGLHVLGTERHEARRIDNQLRGRAGRQGDPGSSRFYLSLEDDLMRIFGSDRLTGLMERLGLEEGQDIQHPWVTKAIESAQRRVEAHNFEIRKHLLEYDNVMNRQREVIYAERRRILEGEELRRHVLELVAELINEALDAHLPPDAEPEAWDAKGLREWLESLTGLTERSLDELHDRDAVRETLHRALTEFYAARETELSPEAMRYLERTVLLQVIDAKWKDHLYAMDALREGIGLRAYGQRDPLVEYQHEGYAMFQEMISRIKEEAVMLLFRVRAVRREAAPAAVFDPARQELRHAEVTAFGGPPAAPAAAPRPSGVVPPRGAAPPAPQTVQRTAPKVGRNEPCPCGSTKKYKKCHGQ